MAADRARAGADLIRNDIIVIHVASLVGGSAHGSYVIHIGGARRDDGQGELFFRPRRLSSQYVLVRTRLFRETLASAIEVPFTKVR